MNEFQSLNFLSLTSSVTNLSVSIIWLHLFIVLNQFDCLYLIYSFLIDVIGLFIIYVICSSVYLTVCSLIRDLTSFVYFNVAFTDHYL